MSGYDNISHGDRSGTIDFSIIIVNFNSAPYIEICLKHIRDGAFNGSKEIIVVNNLSTDGSLRILQKQPDITLINPGKNLGYSTGNNIGISASRGRYILCLNFDCLLNDNFLLEVYNAFESNTQVGMISGKLRKLFNMQPTMYIDSTGIDFTNLVPVDRGEWQYDIGQYDNEKNILGPSGAAGCYKRKALESVAYRRNQYFDEQMFMYCEDIDLAWRLNSAGWQGLYVPEAVAYHERGATRKGDWLKKVEYQLNGSCNRYFTILKNIRRKDIKGRLKKLFFQEFRLNKAYSGWSIVRWAILGYVLSRLFGMVLRPSFIEKRNLAHKWGKNTHLDFSLDTDFWKRLQEKRRKTPLNKGHLSKNDLGIKITVEKELWQVTEIGFRDTLWNRNGFFFSGVYNRKKSFLEIIIPEKYQEEINNFYLNIELNADADVFFDILVFSGDGEKTRSDWCIFSGGNGLFSFNLRKTDLVASPDCISIWQGPWVAMRVSISMMHKQRINIRKMFFTEENKRISA